jgi:chromosome segregation ATPase
MAPRKLWATAPGRQKVLDMLMRCGKDPELPGKLSALRKRTAKMVEVRSPWHSKKQHAERTQKPAGERPEELDVSALAAKKEELEAQRKVREDALKAADEVLTAAQIAEKEEKDAARNIGELEVKLAEWKEAKARHTADANKLGAKAIELNTAACTLPYDEQGIEDTRAKLAEATDITKAQEPWKKWDTAQDEKQEAKDNIQALNKTIDQLKADERQLLQNAGIQITGLTFDEDSTPLLHGRVLDKASGREWFEFAVELATADDPELGVIIVDEDANGVDADGMAAMRELMESKGYQLVVARIEPSGATTQIVVCDGDRAWMQPQVAAVDAP